MYLTFVAFSKVTYALHFSDVFIPIWTKCWSVVLLSYPYATPFSFSYCFWCVKMSINKCPPIFIIYVCACIYIFIQWEWFDNLTLNMISSTRQHCKYTDLIFECFTVLLFVIHNLTDTILHHNTLWIYVWMKVVYDCLSVYLLLLYILYLNPENKFVNKFQ